ncbi:septum formation inhibitor Maf [Bacterioplanes sanyensis]|uniref:7-methyl-GTP pyrophosphatase n=1 Tax=Bacterioplanes sanyensis TaxID=1249553 RepID=A0A222FFI5_9GAMM|nr:nucleoside triphosphate pyrophosphatase [Bacterioplanes sanyensis]ASP37392.1 septum formation inhibitor Maf [Bacterioplanes sanyensis]
MKLLLASSSPYRQQLLNQLRIEFDCASPDIDETPLAGETPHDYVKRLAENKAAALATDYPHHWIIGSDQTCVLNGTICGKPGSADKAEAQLMAASGQRVEFLTGLCLRAPDGQHWSLVEPFAVQFRPLTQALVKRYVELEQPLNCAGSFKVEGLGISLFEALDGRDFNSLIGLPLIGLRELLAQAGVEMLQLAH